MITIAINKGRIYQETVQLLLKAKNSRSTLDETRSQVSVLRRVRLSLFGGSIVR